MVGKQTKVGLDLHLQNGLAWYEVVYTQIKPYFTSLKLKPTIRKMYETKNLATNSNMIKSYHRTAVVEVHKVGLKVRLLVWIFRAPSINLELL